MKPLAITLLSLGMSGRVFAQDDVPLESEPTAVESSEATVESQSPAEDVDAAAVTAVEVEVNDGTVLNGKVLTEDAISWVPGQALSFYPDHGPKTLLQGNQIKAVRAKPEPPVQPVLTKSQLIQASENRSQLEAMYTEASQSIKRSRALGVVGGISATMGMGVILGSLEASSTAGLGPGAGLGAGLLIGGVMVSAMGSAGHISAVNQQTQAVQMANPSATGQVKTSAAVIPVTTIFGLLFPPFVLLPFVMTKPQISRNQVDWLDRPQASNMDERESHFTVNLTPMTTPDVNGLMLSGTF